MMKFSQTYRNTQQNNTERLTKRCRQRRRLLEGDYFHPSGSRLLCQTTTRGRVTSTILCKIVFCFSLSILLNLFKTLASSIMQTLHLIFKNRSIIIITLKAA